MPDNTPARTEPGTELERREAPISRADTDSWTQVVAMTSRLAAEIAGTEFVPKDLRGKPAAVTAAILYGREVGLPPMTALTQTYVVEGRPSASAQALRALVLAAGHEIVFRESTGAICRIGGRRRGSSTWTEIVWTIDMAKAITLPKGGTLANKDNWRNYPRRMLQARATSELCELVFPDVVMGMRSLEEAQDEAAEEGPAPIESTVSRAPSTTPRKRAARKVETTPTVLDPPPAGEARPAEPEPGAMPLPGEDGYEDPGNTPRDDAGADSGASEPVEAQPPAEPATEPVRAETDERAHREVVESDGEHTNHRCTVCKASSAEPLEGPCPGPPSPAQITRAQVRMLNARLGGLSDAAGVKLDDNERRGIVRVLAGREEPITSTNELTKAEGSAVIDTLTRTETLEDLYALVEATVEALKAGDGS